MTARLFAAHLTSGAMLLFGAAAASNVTPTPTTPAVPQAKKKVVVETLAPVAVNSTPTYRRYVHPQAKAMAGPAHRRASSTRRSARCPTRS